MTSQKHVSRETLIAVMIVAFALTSVFGIRGIFFPETPNANASEVSDKGWLNGSVLGSMPVLMPNPNLSPEEVLRIILPSLSANDIPYPDRGIELAWQFSSPQNRALLGSIENFSEVAHQPEYRAFLENNGYFIYPLRYINENRVQAMIRIVGKDDLHWLYRWHLIRETDGGYPGSWMTLGADYVMTLTRTEVAERMKEGPPENEEPLKFSENGEE